MLFRFFDLFSDVIIFGFLVLYQPLQFFQLNVKGLHLLFVLLCLTFVVFLGEVPFFLEEGLLFLHLVDLFLQGLVISFLLLELVDLALQVGDH